MTLMEIRNCLPDPAQGLPLTAQFRSIPLPSAPTSAVSKGVQLGQTLAFVQCAKLESYFLFPGTSSARGCRGHKPEPCSLTSLSLLEAQGSPSGLALPQHPASEFQEFSAQTLVLNYANSWRLLL